MPDDSAYRRSVLGPSAALSTDTYLLRRIEHRLAGANWQRGGGKGRKPEPVPLPGESKAGRPRKATSADDMVQRLRNLGLIPVGASA